MNTDLKGNTAIVGGCTQGIGKAIAEKFAANGADLILLARNSTKLNNMADAIKNKYGVNTYIVVADFDEYEELDQQIKKFLTAYSGTIDILVNNVRGPISTEVLGITPQQMHNVLQRHLVCNHTLAMHVIPRMRENKYGRIINIVDTIYHTPYPGLGLSTVRASEVSWAKALSFEVAKDGITVNNILPGPTETDGFKEIMKHMAAEKGLAYDELKKSLTDLVPDKRFAAPSEIANAALFLASKESAYVTGTNLTIDGGFTPSI